MAWENYDLLFPDGVIPNWPGLTKKDLIDNNIDVVISTVQEFDGDMIRSIKQYIYGQDGSYSINTRYDIQDALRHAEGIYALSDYGAKMLSNHLKERDIKFDKSNFEGMLAINSKKDLSPMIQEKESLRYIEN